MLRPDAGSALAAGAAVAGGGAGPAVLAGLDRDPFRLRPGAGAGGGPALSCAGAAGRVGDLFLGTESVHAGILESLRPGFEQNHAGVGTPFWVDFEKIKKILSFCEKRLPFRAPMV